MADSTGRSCELFVTASLLKPRSVVSQPRFGGPRKSLAVAGNPRRDIFNLSLSYCRAPTHSTWIMCTTVYLPSSPSLASVHTTRVSSATSQHRREQPNAPRTENVSLCLRAPSFSLHKKKTPARGQSCLLSVEFSPCTDACMRDPSAASRSCLVWRLISISGVNLYKY